LLERHGVSVARRQHRGALTFGERVDVTRRLADGEPLEFAGRTLRALHRPGHSPSDTVFLDEADGTLLAGDHLLPHISSNPLISRQLGGKSGEPGDGRPRALLTYIASLRETREMELSQVLPGHGDPFSGHAELIDERFALHERRASKIHGLISQEPMTAHEIAHALWGNVAVTQAFLTLSEVLGHVDLLVERGQASEVETGGVIRFQAV